MLEQFINGTPWLRQLIHEFNHGWVVEPLYMETMIEQFIPTKYQFNMETIVQGWTWFSNF